MARLLVLDENMWPRLATVELIGRGRAAIALKHTELLGAEDPEVITTVGGWTDVVLVTNDDNMPSEHGDLLARSGLTLAVLAPRTDRAFSLQAWERETVHRWVHLIATQSDGSVVRYTPFGHSMWRPRRRSTVAATGAVKPAIPKQPRIEKSLRQKPEEHEFPLES